MKIPRLLLLCLCFSAPLRADEIVVLVTVKPLAWLVQALAPPGAAVQVLIPDGQSPHDYPLRPADAARIEHAALLVWVGPGLEPWLVQVANRLPASRQLALLPHAFDHDEDSGVHQHEQHSDVLVNDPHIWLDPLALREQAVPIAQALSQLYPAQADEIHARLTQFRQEMSALDKQIATQLEPVAQTGFVVYHDGYQRLVQRYHLNQRAAVWHHEDIPAGARERAALLALLHSGEVLCLFYEPEHGADAVNGWLGSVASGVKMVELDPLGEKVPAGADAYARFLRGLVGQMVECLQ